MNKSEEILVKFVEDVKVIAGQTYGETIKKQAMEINILKKANIRLHKMLDDAKHPEPIMNGELIPSLEEAIIIWGVEDILCRAEDMDKYMSEPVAQQILYLMKKNHDAEAGINWDTIDHWIDYYTDHKEEFHK